MGIANNIGCMPLTNLWETKYRNILCYSNNKLGFTSNSFRRKTMNSAKALQRALLRRGIEFQTTIIPKEESASRRLIGLYSCYSWNKTLKSLHSGFGSAAWRQGRVYNPAQLSNPPDCFVFIRAQIWKSWIQTCAIRTLEQCRSKPTVLRVSLSEDTDCLVRHTGGWKR